MIDTDRDIKSRKAKALDAIRKLSHFWKNNKTPIKTKVKIFSALVGSIFLYNAYLWSMNSTRDGQIDAFQRRLLRYAIDISWPRKINNIALYNMTRQVPWSKIIAYRRLCWFGHMTRLPDDTPVKHALREMETEVRKPRGRPKTTWLGGMKAQLENDLGMSWGQAVDCATDRDCWKGKIAKFRPQWAEVPGKRR